MALTERKIALVSCASRKTGNASAAEALYTSDLFRKAGTLANQKFDAWYILSAKHGLLAPQQEIEPYDETLNRLPLSARKLWADNVGKQLAASLTPGDEIFFFAGRRYREFLDPMLMKMGFQSSAPMAGLSIGRQLQWLNVVLQEKHRIADLVRLYELLRLLTLKEGGGRVIGNSTGKMNWPAKGLYFFFEPEERRFLESQTCRIVRVGTHGVSIGSKSTLWGRLRTHRGADSGSGNHRGSIFRLHVGNALQTRGSASSAQTWGKGQSADRDTRIKETELEQEVSAFLGKMAVICIGIEDEPSAKSDRAYLERNIIGLLCGPTGPVDLPSENWLGRFSKAPEIRYSGLWNVDFVTTEYDRHCLDVLEQYVEVALGKRPPPTSSLAPPGWGLKKPNQKESGQLSLSFSAPPCR